MLVAPSARAEVSRWCLWTQLYDLHAVATRCAGKVPPDVETRYEQLRRAIELAVFRDAALRAGESEESARAEMARYAASSHAINPARCGDPDLKKAVKAFGILTSPETIATLEGGLANRRDPYEGDCL